MADDRYGGFPLNITATSVTPASIKIDQIMNVTTVADQAAMVALTDVQQGDVVYRNDTASFWRLVGTNAADSNQWIEIETSANNWLSANKVTVGNGLTTLYGRAIVTRGAYSIIKDGGGVGVDQIDFGTDLLAAGAALTGTNSTINPSFIVVYSEPGNTSLFSLAGVSNGAATNSVATLGNLGGGTALSATSGTVVAAVFNFRFSVENRSTGTDVQAWSYPDKNDIVSGGAFGITNDGGTVNTVGYVVNKPFGTATYVFTVANENTSLDIPVVNLIQDGAGVHYHMVPKASLSAANVEGDVEAVTGKGILITDNIGRFRLVRPYPKFVSVSANYTITSGDLDGYMSTHISVDATVGAITVTLPAANSVGAGEWTITITDAKDKAATNNITIAPAGTDTISNAANQVLTANGESITVITDGVSNWQVI